MVAGVLTRITRLLTLRGQKGKGFRMHAVYVGLVDYSPSTAGDVVLCLCDYSLKVISRELPAKGPSWYYCYGNLRRPTAVAVVLR